MSIPTEEQIRTVLRRYVVRNHYKASQETFRQDARGRYTRSVKYAVWTNGRQISDPMSHREAKDQAEKLTIRDLLALVGG